MRLYGIHSMNSSCAAGGERREVSGCGSREQVASGCNVASTSVYPRLHQERQVRHHGGGGCLDAGAGEQGKQEQVRLRGCNGCE